MRAVILGGTGAIGGATAMRLRSAGWDVDVTGRDVASVPAELIAAGVRFHTIERADVLGIGGLAGTGVDLLVDAVSYCGSDVRRLLPVMADAASCVVISSRAVYVDDEGRHINGEEPPRFAVPLPETNPTVAPATDVDPFSREGYAPGKVAVERAALDSGLPVTVIRPSKVHGRWARNARTRPFVERMLAGDRVIPLPHAEAVDHLTAAVNTAALIEVVAHSPGRRILNSADPDAPPAGDIVRSIASRLGWNGTLEVVHAEDGMNPWSAANPIVLDMTAAAQLGYVPQGSALELLSDEVDWVAAVLRAT
ncbi:nucleoside-diphosphate sugar epimerase [Microbacterium sp. Root61]|uniref:nucleoside-diphosphate sugar epimerase n=1 Tax=Microbacterium sp. Root61 TaxID=1736570 RepID=UPI0006F7D03A|nr:nucleoside-diphosphate sugar epimerase [Microbacterium sp. Root61]KRA25208.1 nucleoside-diphosphate sugar epimerase [Microbacterium sp. Root61]